MPYHNSKRTMSITATIKLIKLSAFKAVMHGQMWLKVRVQSFWVKEKRRPRLVVLPKLSEVPFELDEM